MLPHQHAFKHTLLLHQRALKQALRSAIASWASGGWQRKQAEPSTSSVCHQRAWHQMSCIGTVPGHMAGPEQALARLQIRMAGLPASLQLQEDDYVPQYFSNSCCHPKHGIRSELLGTVLLKDEGPACSRALPAGLPAA